METGFEKCKIHFLDINPNMVEFSLYLVIVINASLEDTRWVNEKYASSGKWE